MDNFSFESVSPKFCAVVFSQKDIACVLKEVPSWDKERDIMIARTTATACFLEERGFRFEESWAFCGKSIWPELVEEAWNISREWQKELSDIWRYRDIDIALSFKMTIGFFLEDALFSSAVSLKIIEKWKDCIFYIPSQLRVMREYDSRRESDVFCAIFLYLAKKEGAAVRLIKNKAGKRSSLTNKTVLAFKILKKFISFPRKFIRKIFSKINYLIRLVKHREKLINISKKLPIFNNQKPLILFRGTDFDFERQILLVKYIKEIGDFNVLHLYEGGRDDWISKSTKLYRQENFVLDMRKINLSHGNKEYGKNLELEKAFLVFAKIYSRVYPEIFDNPYLDFQFKALFGNLSTSTMYNIDIAYTLLATYRPKLVFQHQDFLWFESSFTQVARKMGITTINLPHSIIGHPAYGDFSSNYQIVYGEAEREKLTGYGKEPKRILVAGNPLIDKGDKYGEPIIGVNKEGKYLIVVLTGALDHGIVPCVDRSLYMECIRKIVQIAKEDSKINVIIRLHPRTDHKEKYESIIKDRRADKNVKIEIGGHSYDSFKRASLIIVPGIGSGVAVEAALFKKPLLFVKEPQVIERGVMWTKYAPDNIVYKVKDLESRMYSTLLNDKHRQKLILSGEKLFSLYNESLGSDAIRRTYKIIRNLYNKEINLEGTEFISKTISYIDSLGISKYAYKYARFQKKPTLYSSLYAVMTLSLFNELDKLLTEEKEGWAEYIQSYQCEDGLFRDSVVANEIAETEDWWGWRHLTCHAIIALTALNTKARKPFKMLEFLYHDGKIKKWLKSRDWKNKPDFVSNEILNYGTLLQYTRDFHNDERAAKALHEMYNWLDEHQDPKTGLWGTSSRDKHTLSIGVQTAYHIWLLYFYDKKPIQYIERCIDSCLKTQNRLGGFGVRFNSSACEDIDSIDPLARFHFMTEYRRNDIKKALTKAYKWVLVNMNKDGGFVFSRGKPLIYGHELMSSKADESAMFPTWFRTLSLAYLSKVIDEPNLKKISWNFVDCSGYQFWKK